jgi:hypothetical protein
MARCIATNRATIKRNFFKFFIILLASAKSVIFVDAPVRLFRAQEGVD